MDMKKGLLIWAAFFAINANAQTEFYQLINSINWNSTEDDILQEYSAIRPRKHFYSDYDKTMTDYEFENIALGKYNCTASIFVDSISRKIHSLSFSFVDKLETIKDAKTLSKEMDHYSANLTKEKIIGVVNQ
jgi:hypothetical protein